MIPVLTIPARVNRVRVCSLLPSATEIVFALGMGRSLVGVTHECDYPAETAGIPKVTRSLIPAGSSSAEIDAAVKLYMAQNGATVAAAAVNVRQRPLS